MIRPGTSPKLALLAIGATLLLVTAGCSSLLAKQHEYPPGVAESGVQNATALANAHQEHLRQGFRVSYTATYTAENGSVLQRVESKQRWSPNESNRTISLKSPHALLGVHTEVYRNDTEVVAQVETASGDVVVRSISRYNARAVLPNPGVYWETVYGMVAARNTSVTAFENGTTRITFRTGNVSDSRRHGHLYVDPSGVVTRIVVTETTRIFDTTVTRHGETNVSHVGTPAVRKPTFVSNNTTTSDATTSFHRPNTG